MNYFTKITLIILSSISYIEIKALIKHETYEDFLIEEWFTAIKNNDHEAVQELIGRVDANVKNKEGHTALRLASHKGDLEMTKLLLTARDIDINARTNHGNTPLKRILMKKQVDIDMVKLLLQVPGIDINAKNNFGHTPLHSALAKGHDDIVKLLLQVPSIDVNIKENEDWTPLILAANQNKETAVALLLNDPHIQVNAQNDLGDTALLKAVYQGNDNIVKLLLEAREIDVNIQNVSGESAVMVAAYRGHANIVKMLLQVSHIDINLTNKEGWSALAWAVSQKQEAIVTILLESGLAINVNGPVDDGRTPLMIAAQEVNENIVIALLHHPDIQVNALDNVGLSALLYAANAGSVNVMQILLQVPGIDVDIQDGDGATSLIWAAIKKNEPMAKLLLQYPIININARTKKNRTASMCAEDKNQVDIVALIKNKAEELTQKAFQAISSNDIETLKKIIQIMGPTVVDAIDAEGDTLLHRAFTANSAPIIILLLQTATDIRKTLATGNKKGIIPLELINPTSPVFCLCLELAYLNCVPKLTVDPQKTALKSQVINFMDSLFKTGDKKQITNCAKCSKPNCVQWCGQCKKVYYCSAECQKADWKAHKLSCV